MKITTGGGCKFKYVLLVIDAMFQHTFICRFSLSVYKSNVRSFSVKAKEKGNKKYTSSIQLPRTQFPQWMGSSKRIELDEFILKNCGFNELYAWQQQNLSGKEFLLHDGPPYANGMPHMGHAINKVLKDIINRSKVLNGTKVHYKPGWDCHGLPIELKALRGKIDLTPLEIRKKAKTFARQAINDQRAVFKTWGLMADWEQGCYYTFDQTYVKNQLHQFYKLYKKKLIYREMKPVYWSPSSRTALAEAELEYKEDHESHAVTLRLEVQDGKLSEAYKPLYLLIWTTTPWTLPANEAVSFNPLFDYSVIQFNGGNYIICSKLVQGLQEKLKYEIKEMEKIKGNCLNELKYRHPLNGNLKPLLPAAFVTDNVGTGLVHTAPSHGPDDYLLGLEHQLPIISYVDETGHYTKEAGHLLVSCSALDEGVHKVCKILEKDIVLNETIKHSYPYDWRTKKPTMIRASKQWFVDTKSIKKRALDVLSDVKIIPERNLAGLLSQVENRPYWCISRQRAWGVPIPVIYDELDNIIISEKLIDHFCTLIDREGVDFWWTSSISDLMPEELCNKIGVEQNHLKKGEDILDIWFDSGLSWSSVLHGQVADLYLEGIDQFTGWFQSSLLTSVALKNQAPYKSILAHGFAVDEDGRKMSKSIGNVVNPQDIVFGNPSTKSHALGIDILRWWVAGHSLQHTNIPVSTSTLNDSVTALKKIRNLIKFLLGSIHDLPLNVKPEMFLIDRYLISETDELTHKVISMYSTYEFNKICKLVINFLTNEVSSFYCTLTKDRLYCDEVNSDKRRAVQVTMNHILHSLLLMIGPIVPVLAEEVFHHHPHNTGKLHYFHGNWKSLPEQYHSNEISSVIEKVMTVRDELMKEKPVNIDISKLSCIIDAGEEYWTNLKVLQDNETSSDSQLVELLQTSEVKLKKSEQSSSFNISVKATKKLLCERCRKYTSEEENCLCQRCLSVIKNIRNH